VTAIWALVIALGIASLIALPRLRQILSDMLAIVVLAFVWILQKVFGLKFDPNQPESKGWIPALYARVKPKVVRVMAICGWILLVFTLTLIFAVVTGNMVLLGAMFTLLGIFTVILFRLSRAFGRDGKPFAPGITRTLGSWAIGLLFFSLLALARGEVLMRMGMKDVAVIAIVLLILSTSAAMPRDEQSSLLHRWMRGSTVVIAFCLLMFLLLGFNVIGTLRGTADTVNVVGRAQSRWLQAWVTDLFRRSVPGETDAQMTTGTITERAGLYLVTFNEDNSVKSVQPKMIRVREGQAERKTQEFLEPGKIIKTRKARPELLTEGVGEPLLEIQLSNPNSDEFVNSEVAFIVSRKVRLSGPPDQPKEKEEVPKETMIADPPRQKNGGGTRSSQETRNKSETDRGDQTKTQTGQQETVQETPPARGPQPLAELQSNNQGVTIGNAVPIVPNGPPPLPAGTRSTFVPGDLQRVNVRNTTRSPADISLVNEAGEEVRVRTLVPGEIYEIDVLVGQIIVVRRSGAGTILAIDGPQQYTLYAYLIAVR